MIETFIGPLLSGITGGILGALSASLMFISKFNTRLTVVEDKVGVSAVSRAEMNVKLSDLLQNVGILQTELRAISTQMNVLISQQSLLSDELSGLKVKVGVVESQVGDFRTNLHALSNFVMASAGRQ